MLQFFHWKLPSLSFWTPDCLPSIQTTLLHFWHQNLPRTFHKNKDLWTTSLFFHGPDTVELITIWCSSLSINIFFQAILKNSSLQNLHIINPPSLRPHVCAIFHCTFLHLQYIYLYHTCVLSSEFGHVWLLITLVYLLKLLYVNSCVVGGRMAWNLYFNFLSCPLYVFRHFSAAFCTAHCALDLARDHAP